MILFIKLLLAHLLGDFLLQPTSWVLDKETKKLRSKYLYIHILVHGIIASILIREMAFVPFAVGLAIIHGAIDFLKLYFQKKKTKRIWFISDQLLHLLSIIGIAFLYVQPNLENTTIDSRFWVVITGIIFVTFPASILIKNSISIWTPESKDTTDDSLQNAGNYIGMLERLFVCCFILTGHFEAIGFLLAAKSIFRFGDLSEAKDRKLTEYVLIGTLLSFGIAIATGLLVQYGLLQTL
jgi:protein-S-isoprenylcysteine O-methyltransferase Ste14